MVDFKALAAPFPPERISWRIGSTTKDKARGMARAYIDARDVMERLDAVCGPQGWQRFHPHENGTTVCRIAIKVGDEWVAKEDGAGDTDVEKEKGALSDSFKRAAVNWGIGRYLYDTASPWVELEAAGNSYRIKDSEFAKLRASLAKGAPAAAATKETKGDDPFSPPPAAKTNGSKGWAIQVPAKKDGSGADWPEWGKTMEEKIRLAPGVAALDKLWSDNGPALKNCPEHQRGELFDQYQARRTYHQRSAAA